MRPHTKAPQDSHMGDSFICQRRRTMIRRKSLSALGIASGIVAIATLLTFIETTHGFVMPHSTHHGVKSLNLSTKLHRSMQSFTSDRRSRVNQQEKSCLNTKLLMIQNPFRTDSDSKLSSGGMKAGSSISPNIMGDSGASGRSDKQYYATGSLEETTDSSTIYKDAVTRTILWVAGAAVFGVGLWYAYGEETAAEFYAGYLVEQSLSVDNLFVFLLLFDYFKVPLSSQDRVLNYGIYGAVVMRAFMIGVGAVALQQFHGILLVFAAVLVYSSANVLLNLGGEEEEEEDMGENRIVQFSRNLFDATDEFDGDRFFTLVDGIRKATPLFICMVAVEISDVVFAVDSIPAVFGVTENPFVVFTSNMFAIMGLRSLYTILSKAASELVYLEPAVAVVLGFIGSKMVAEYFGFTIATEVSLAVVITVLFTGILASIYSNKQEEAGKEI